MVLGALIWWRPFGSDEQREVFHRVWISHMPQSEQDGLESISTDEVRLRLISALRPGLLEEASTANGDSFLYLIMPVRLNV